MKLTKVMILAMLFALATVSLACAGTQVAKNQTTALSAKIQNNTGNAVRAAVKLTGYDDRGGVIGNLCKETWLSSYRETAVDFTWQAPAYATGVYWGSMVEVNGTCPSATTGTGTGVNNDYNYDYDHDYGYGESDEEEHDSHDDDD